MNERKKLLDHIDSKQNDQSCNAIDILALLTHEQIEQAYINQSPYVMMKYDLFCKDLLSIASDAKKMFSSSDVISILSICGKLYFDNSNDENVYAGSIKNTKTKVYFDMNCKRTHFE